ncbi:hexose transporter [Grosmannia clavigera kw1407]|uniref:Hexose transporter n=1 Tax=Grosmannia clavigera (strain kw1407 / UAMH 11150) TaxID=655863 RepID=F0XJ63_GROCL|nr:hexose transporter [Grosmannia clavigera kw1407]EFX02370.1 hexose transporter [Grosmannia clavigera kw1407]
MEALSQSVRMSLTTALVVSVCIVDSVTIAYDGSVMGSVNVMKSYQSYFHLDTATISVNSCAVYLGAILVAPISGYIVNWRGRREAIGVSCLFNIVGAAISGAAQNIAMFIAGRMIIGIGMGLAQTSAGAYVSETTAPKVRSLALGLYFTCWALGGFIATGTQQMDPSDWAWRIPCIVQAFAPVCVLGILPFLPESPRWLIYNDRNEEGLAVLARINGALADDTAVQLQYQEVLDTMTYEKTEGRSLGFREIVRSPANRKRLGLALSVAPLTMLTGSNVITYYYGTMLDQAGITSSKTQMEVNLVLSAWQFVIAVLGSLLAERLGRRFLCLASLATCTAFLYGLGGMTATYGGSSSTSGIYGTVAFMFFFLGCYSFGLTPLTNMYPPEVLSYNLRATGMAMFTLCAKACGVFVTMVFPYMFSAIGWKTYIVNASWNVLFLVWVYFFWVETRDKNLEEIDELFDGIRHSDVPTLKQMREKTAAVSVVEV